MTAPPSLEARIGGVVCGLGELFGLPGVEESVRYRVKVAAASADAPDCGAPGRSIEFWILQESGRSAGVIVERDVWSSPQPRELMLRAPE
jgi:hypothetical protein